MSGASTAPGRVAGQVLRGPQRVLRGGDPGPGGFQFPVGQGPRRGLPLGGGLLALGHLRGGLGGDQRLCLLPGRAAALDPLPSGMSAGGGCSPGSFVKVGNLVVATAGVAASGTVDERLGALASAGVAKSITVTVPQRATLA